LLRRDHPPPVVLSVFFSIAVPTGNRRQEYF
jgi:hypothetical protein